MSPSAVPTSSTLYGSPSASKRATASSRRALAPLPAPALLQLAPNLGLDLLEILLADRLRKLEVVVEAVLDRRPDRDLDPGVEAAYGLGEQVRRRMAQNRERVRVLAVARRQELDPRTLGERQAQVLDAPVGADEHGLLGELRPDRAGSVEPGRAGGKLELGVVGKDDLHGTGQGYAPPCRRTGREVAGLRCDGGGGSARARPGDNRPRAAGCRCPGRDHRPEPSARRVTGATRRTHITTPIPAAPASTPSRRGTKEAAIPPNPPTATAAPLRPGSAS